MGPNPSTLIGSILVYAIAVTAGSPILLAADKQAGYCSQTAQALFVGCKGEGHDDAFVAKANCLNVSNARARSGCLDDLRSEEADKNRLCLEQRDWRVGACAILGEGRYDPQLDPSRFDRDFTHLTNPNPYFPLTIGNRWVYRSGPETNTVEVLNATKSIEGLTAIVVRDDVFEDGNLTEGTNDWYAQALDGTVWYLGEETGEYETFDGDNPMTPELVTIDGSFKHGRDSAKGGIIFLASPRPGSAYLEEFSLGNAEDVTQVLSTTYAYGLDPELDALVPQALAERFCSGDCVVTKNFSLLEPGIFARKYYARGVGVFLEVEPDSNTVDQLVDCNFDPRCVGLPTP